MQSPIAYYRALGAAENGWLKPPLIRLGDPHSAGRDLGEKGLHNRREIHLPQLVLGTGPRSSGACIGEQPPKDVDDTRQT
jgi:hypothetical protein